MKKPARKTVKTAVPRGKKAPTKRAAKAVSTKAATAKARTPVAAPPKKIGRKAEVVALMKRLEGVTVDQIVAATGVLSHSARALITRVRQSGQQVITTKVDGLTVYRIA